MNSVFTVITSGGGVRYFIPTSEANLSFGDFGYEISLSGQFQSGDTLRIINNHKMRILYQRGDKELDICWKPLGVNTNDTCGHDYDYPLLAIEASMCVYQCFFLT